MRQRDGCDWLPGARGGFFVWLAFLASAAQGAELNFKITDAQGAALADAVVSLVSLDSAPSPPPAPATEGAKVEIGQEKQEFIPYVTAIQVGTAVRLPNRDTVEHHVYSESPAKKLEFPLYAPGKAETVIFDRPGMVALGCNIHDWMLAYVVVVPTPWFAVSGRDGTATLADAPAGRYRAEVWHPRFAKVQTREITLPNPDSAALTFAAPLRKDQRVQRPIDAGGKGYR